MAIARRDFLSGAAASAACLAGADAMGATKSAPPASVSFLAFADIHYCPGVFPHDSREWLERVLARAEERRVDFVIHAGDFAHNPAKDNDYVAAYNDFKLPTYHTLGNHDTEGCTLAETLAAYRMERGNYHFDRNGFRFVVLDTNYFRADGRFVHFEGGNYRKVPSSQSWTCSSEQYEWLEGVLKQSPYPCVVFMHQSCERERGGMPDWKRMRNLFRWVNRHCGNRVWLVVNGHHHTDGFRFIDGIAYLDLNSANYKYYAESHRLYPAEYLRSHTGASHVIAWEDPISAVITIDAAGRLKIEGQTSRFFMDVSPEKAKFPQRDKPVAPNIQSVDIRLNHLVGQQENINV